MTFEGADAEYCRICHRRRRIGTRGFRIPGRCGESECAARLVTGPGDEDWASEDLRPYLTKYLVGRDGVSAEQRMKMMNFIRDLTSSDYGGYQEVLAIHAEGSLEAEKLQVFRAYNDNGGARRVMKLASRMADV